MNSFDSSSSYPSKNFESLFDGFLSFLSISKSSFTVNQYKYTIKVFFNFTKSLDINKETFYFFIKLQKEKGNSAAYIRNIFATVKTFYKYLNDFNIYKIDNSVFNVELPQYTKECTQAEKADLLLCGLYTEKSELKLRGFLIYHQRRF